jgi:hypothetical protein
MTAKVVKAGSSLTHAADTGGDVGVVHHDIFPKASALEDRIVVFVKARRGCGPPTAHGAMQRGPKALSAIALAVSGP